MVFSTHAFLFAFLGLVLVAYYLTPRRFKVATLTLASFIFYGWWRPDFVLLMLTSALVDYVVGWQLGKTESKGKRRLFLLISMVTNLGLLGYFKYVNFGIDTLNALVGTEYFWPKVILPVGISFYTFQSMSYTIDVFRREVKPVKNALDFICYVSLFPQLVAGPIVRYRDVQDQLRNRTHTLKKFGAGVLLFQMGFVKKILIADRVGEIADKLYGGNVVVEGESAATATSRIVEGIADPTFAESWMGSFAYAFQIYFDFSGYSDMAIGLGLMFGFVFPINFNSPYQSYSITDFWRRWHISLSNWLRDYLYIPLGGNRKGVVRTYVNLALTMLLGGLWHGPAWTFVAWGAYQGLWLILERLSGKRSYYAFLPKPGQIFVTFLIATVGWVFFRAASFDQAMAFIQSMFGFGGGDVAALSYDRLRIDRFGTVVMAAAAILCFFFRPSQEAVGKSWIVPILIPALFLLAVGDMLFEAYRPFLYFQF